MGLFSFLRLFKVSRADSTDLTAMPSPVGPIVNDNTYIPEAVVAQTSDGKGTSVDCQEFLLELPFAWLPTENEASLELRNQTLPEQLIITARSTTEPLTPEARTQVIDAVVIAHSNALKQASKGKVQLSEIQRTASSDECEGRIYAKTDDILAALAVRYTPSVVVTFALYRYSHQDFGMPFGVYAATVFDLLKMKKQATRTGTSA